MGGGQTPTPTKWVLENGPSEIQSGRLEAALASADSATAALGLEGASAARIESTTATTTARFSRGAGSAFSRFVQSQFSACQISSVQGLYRFGCILVIFELDEGEAPRASCRPVHRQGDVGYWAHGAEKLD